MQFDKVQKTELTNIDKLLIDYLEDLTDFTDKAYEKYDFYNPVSKLRYFLWEIFASHYLEMVKSRAYNKDNKFSKKQSNSAKYTLHYLLERFLVLIYPVIPQVTTNIAEYKKINLFKTEFPKAKKGKSDLTLVGKIIEFNKKVWKNKKDKGISLRNEIKGIKIPKELKKFEQDLITTHNLI